MQQPYGRHRPLAPGFGQRLARARREHAGSDGDGPDGDDRGQDVEGEQELGHGCTVGRGGVGAFIFAATGLLDGLRATTHWIAAPDLAARHPAVTVDPNVLYVDNGQFLTSAGAAAAMDMCLHMIRKDHGSAVAAFTARMCVMPLEREGGQAQFIVHDQPSAPAGATMEPLLRWLEENVERDLTLDDIALHAGTSARTLNRRFREQTGTTPLQWLHRARVRRAQYLLESTDHTVDRIATQAGFGSPTAFRDRFKRVVGTSPYAYRRAFRGSEPPGCPQGPPRTAGPLIKRAESGVVRFPPSSYIRSRRNYRASHPVPHERSDP
uniref:GlxA family transcriptional regulator n=1 Tax=Streptomyces sp. TG1A-60 TaxID=3129111 RepID=UPI00403FD36D